MTIWFYQINCQIFLFTVRISEFIFFYHVWENKRGGSMKEEGWKLTRWITISLCLSKDGPLFYLSLTTKKTKKWTRFWCDSPRVVDPVSLTPLPSHLQYITLFPIAHPCSATSPPGPRPRASIGRCVSHHFSLRPFILEDFNGYPTENIKYVVVEIH